MSFISLDKIYSASSLSMACNTNHLQVAQLLINNGAIIDYQNSMYVIVSIAFTIKMKYFSQ